MRSIYHQLKEQAQIESSVGGEYFKSSLERFFVNSFQAFYKSTYEWNANFDIPEDYLEFMEAFENDTVCFHGIEQYIYGFYQMVTYTFNYMHNDSNEESYDRPIFWLAVGHRNDRGNFFLCCDKSSDLYGKVGEFYDSSPFLDETDFIEVGESFESFCKNVLNGGA